MNYANEPTPFPKTIQMGYGGNPALKEDAPREMSPNRRFRANPNNSIVGIF